MMISLIVRSKAERASRKRQKTGCLSLLMEWEIVSVSRRAPVVPKGPPYLRDEGI